MSHKNWAEGDRVSFLNEVGGGIVLGSTGLGKIRVLNDDGFELEYAPSELLRVSAKRANSLHDISDHHLHMIASNDRMQELLEREKKDQVPLRKATKSINKPDPTIMEIDLHLSVLLDDDRGLSMGEKLQFQLDYFERMLNTAIRERKRRLIVIHGVGQGKLREEVRRVLEHYEHLQFDDADPRRYGHGATEVLLGMR